MPRRTRAESDATAAALLEVARELFADRGYADVGLAEVAAAAGVTRGALYHHYEHKLALFTRVVERVQAEVGEAVAAAADAVEDPWLGFEAGCRTFLTASVADRTRRVLLVDAPAVLGWDAWREQDATHAGRHLDEALTELVAVGLVEVVSAPATSALLSGAMNGAALWLATQDDPDAPDQAWATLTTLLAALRRP